jgi:hypothetical protein
MKSQGRLLLFVIIVADLLIVLAVVGLRLIKSRETPTVAPQATSSAQTTPGLVVYGSVRNESGVGVDHVSIYRSYSAYPGVVIAVTDASGSYQSDFYAIPGDEMVSVWAEQADMQFSPASCSWRHYAGYEMKACNFVVSTTTPIYLPLTSKAPK